VKVIEGSGREKSDDGCERLQRWRVPSAAGAGGVAVARKLVGGKPDSLPMVSPMSWAFSWSHLRGDDSYIFIEGLNW